MCVIERDVYCGTENKTIISRKKGKSFFLFMKLEGEEDKN